MRPLAISTAWVGAPHRRPSAAAIASVASLIPAWTRKPYCLSGEPGGGGGVSADCPGRGGRARVPSRIAQLDRARRLRALPCIALRCPHRRKQAECKCELYRLTGRL